MGKYIGIDLGTTFSCMAYINDDGNPIVISNAEGNNTTASVVFYSEDGNTVVGENAKELSLDNPQNFVEHIKCCIGRGIVGENAVVTSDGRSFEPEEVSAVILRKLKNDAEKLLGDKISGVVITIPEYFNDLQRDATLKAGEIAGLNVLGIINEPTAAAIAYGLNNTNSNKQTIMVYDLGGGTFDVTVIEVENDSIVVKGTSGDRDMGGRNFDILIINDALRKAKEQGIDLQSDAEDYRDLVMKAEKCKKSLSSASRASFTIKSSQGKFSYALTLDEFERMIEQLILQTVWIAEEACEEAGVTYSDLDKILLVGGSTRIPMVAKVLESETGIKPSGEIHPDEAVAIGAAFHVCKLAKRNAEKVDKPQNDSDVVDIPELKKNFEFADVTSHGIGLICLGEDETEFNSIILPKNVTVPAQYKNTYHTVYSFQNEIELQITQGEDSDINYVTIIGSATINISPREKLVDIEVTITCDENSVIHVNVFDLDKDEYLGEMEINRTNNLTKEQVEKSKKLIETLDITGGW